MRGSETVTIHRAGRAVMHGEPGAAEPDRPVRNCIVYPTVGTEDATPRQDVVISELTVVLPPGIDIKATDEVTARGVRHGVDGPPQVYVKGTRERATIVNLLAVA